ncbi:hypothetical protein [Streptomyces sp. CA-251251]|uniref:hypothetical protein n=1 Tax=Streptomyces sp. CA-251251 TaxID=3240063 RepID=UPI003D901B5A
MTTGGKSYYYLTDATGNVLSLADDTGKRTHTYAIPQPYRYAGAYADPTGLFKMGHRYYDASPGPFHLARPLRLTPAFTWAAIPSTMSTRVASWVSGLSSTACSRARTSQRSGRTVMISRH